MKLISIIIPVYNTEKYLPKCLDSMIAQTYHNWEAILVDDGSKDDSGKICDEYAAKDSRFKVVHKANEGVSIARLIAFNHCSGEYVTFVDSDDYVADTMIQVMTDYITKYNVDMIVCKHYDVYGEKIENKNGEKRITGYYNRGDFEDLQCTNLMYDYKLGMTPTIEGLARRIVKKDILNDALKTSIGFWLGEDIICTYYLYEKLNSVYFCDEYLYYYVHREGSATHANPLKIWNAYVKIFDAILSLNHDGIYDKQLPGKMLMSIKQCLFGSNLTSYFKIKELLNTITQSEHIKKYLLNTDKLQLYHFMDKIAYYLIHSKNNLIKNALIKAYVIYKKIKS